MAKVGMKLFSAGLQNATSNICGAIKMGFLAILADASDAAPNFRVLQCHVNFWCLPGLLRRSYFWDVGLKIEVGASAFSRFQIAIPSGTTDHIVDLSSKVGDEAIAQMVFGKPVTVKSGNEYRELEYDKQSWLLVPIGKSSREQAEPSFTLWSLDTAKLIPAGSRIYLRFRFGVRTVGRSWQWKRFLCSRYGALVDVRFTDLREAWNVTSGDALKSRIVPIENLNFFVIAPAAYHLTATSPSVHYIRILEGRAWEKYLDRKTSVWGTETLCIYEWRDQGKPITPADPFRVFLEINREMGFVSLANGLIIALAVLVLAAGGAMLAPHFPRTIPGGFEALYAVARAHVVSVSLGSLLAAAYLLLNVSDESIRRLRWAGPVYDWVEQLFFGIRTQ
jgi:hypothetical protein